MSAAASAAPAAGAVVRLLRLRRFPILQQLQLEEALLRATTDNWIIVNDGTPEPAIVLGISGKPHELVHMEAVQQAQQQQQQQQALHLIKRFTGGGTVVVDQDTIFTALIMRQADLPDVEPFPRPVMQWTEQFYGRVFAPHGAFWLRENDYCFGDRKFGGNAQAIVKGGWVHHTSLLWAFQRQRMALLKQPAKQPDYRQNREHLDFVVPLCEMLPSRLALVEALEGSAAAAGFQVQEATLEEAATALPHNQLCGTRLLDLEQLLAEQAQREEQQQQA